MKFLRSTREDAPKPWRPGSRLALFVGAGALSTGLAPAAAQSPLDTEYVRVDLSVIDDGGIAASPNPLSPSPMSGSQLSLPPRITPVSTLHVAPSQPITLVAPVAEAMPVMAAATTESAASATMAAAAPEPPTPPSSEAAPPPPAEPKIAEAPPAPPAEPKVAEAPPEPVAAPTEQVALPVSGEPGDAIRVKFGGTESKMSAEFKEALAALAESVKDKPELRLQLMAYAGGADLSSSKARRLSLSRALSVRSFLIEKGVRSTRIDVRALGNKTTDEPVNRVDINIVKR